MLIPNMKLTVHLSARAPVEIFVREEGGKPETPLPHQMRKVYHIVKKLLKILQIFKGEHLLLPPPPFRAPMHVTYIISPYAIYYYKHYFCSA